MEQEFRIGTHSFSDEASYQKATKDYDYIQQFQKELDLTQPDMAKSLYERLLPSKYLMKTTIGEAFKDKLVQIFVQHEVQAKKQEISSPKEQSQKELFHKVMQQPTFCLYWSWFRLAQGCFLLGLVAKTYEMLQSKINLSSSVNMQRFCGIVRLLSHVSVWVMIPVSLIILGIFFAQRLLRKPGTTHCIHLVLISGILLCTELLLTI